MTNEANEEAIETEPVYVTFLTQEDVAALVASMPPHVRPPYQLYKSTYIERMTPEEAAIMEGVLNAEEPKLRLLYQSVEYFMSDDPLFAVLHWATAVALGEEGEPNIDRADALLAPEGA